MKKPAATQQSNGKATQEQLQDLWRALLASYVMQMKAPGVPSAEFMNSLRLFLSDNGITKNVGEHLGVVGSIEALSDLSLPFK
jgi:hypothetical protein